MTFRTFLKNPNNYIENEDKTENKIEYNIRINQKFYSNNSEILDIKFLFPFIKTYFEKNSNKDMPMNLWLNDNKFKSKIDDLICESYIENKTEKKRLKRACKEFLETNQLDISIETFKNEISIMYFIAFLKFEVFLVESNHYFCSFNFIEKLFNNTTKNNFLKLLKCKLSSLIEEEKIILSFSNNDILDFFYNFLECSSKNEYCYDWFPLDEKFDTGIFVLLNSLSINKNIVEINKLIELYSEFWYIFLKNRQNTINKIFTTLNEINYFLKKAKSIEDNPKIPTENNFNLCISYKYEAYQEMLNIEPLLNELNSYLKEICLKTKVFNEKIFYQHRTLKEAVDSLNKELSQLYYIEDKNLRKNKQASNKQEFLKIIIFDYLNATNRLVFNEFANTFSDRELYLITNLDYLIEDKFASLILLLAVYSNNKNYYQSFKKELFLRLTLKIKPMDILFIYTLIGKISMKKKYYNVLNYKNLSYEERLLLDKFLSLSNLLNPKNKIRLRLITNPIQILERCIKGLENNFEDLTLEEKYKIYRRLISLDKLL